MENKSLESPESSSPIVTRAVSRGLKGEYINNYVLPQWQKHLLLLLGHFPQELSQNVISWFQSTSGLNLKSLQNFSINDLLTERVNDYALNKDQFECLTLGAALGGATTYLSLALDSPFLPQTFVITLKGGSPDGNVNQYFKRSSQIALEIAKNNPEIVTIQHYDPIHDGWLTRHVNHLRFKLITLPQAYISFIKKRLKKGGAIVYLDGQAEWLRYRVGPRSFFQVGGWGAISPQEFLDGSQRINDFASRSGLKTTSWKLEGFPIEFGPESEWGSESGLAEALETFCRIEGYQFFHLRFPHPNDFSRLAFNTALRLLSDEGRQPSGVLVEMFSQFDSLAALNSGLLPLWLIFNTQDSLDFVREMRPLFPQNKPVFFSPLSTFSVTPDLVPWNNWVQVFEGMEWFNIGTRPSHYPADPRTIVKWADPLHSWVRKNLNPTTSRITPVQLMDVLNSL